MRSVRAQGGCVVVQGSGRYRCSVSLGDIAEMNDSSTFRLHRRRTSWHAHKGVLALLFRIRKPCIQAGGRQENEISMAG